MDKGTYDWMARIEAKQDYILVLLQPQPEKKEKTKKEIEQKPTATE